ncbi:MAG: GAK system ATP-grasp enzyme [Myxococcales bacterium]|nr:GAK system ATP-grasp enzyme [Myxococcales bacterium]
MRIAVVGIPGAWSSELLADAVEKRTGQRCLIGMDQFSCDLVSGRVTAGNWNLESFDAVIVKKISVEYSPHVLDRLEMLRFLEARGVRIFSSPAHLLGLIDRLSCTVTLRAAGIPMPPTTITESIEDAAAAVARYGEAIAKPMYSTKARGMEVLRPGGDLLDRLRVFRAAGNPVLYLQKKLTLPGRDLGLAFLGGRHLGAYARVAGKGAWNTTILAGGRYEPVVPPADIVALAHRAQAVFGLDFTGVDIVETEEGPLVLEVSAFGGFRGLVEASNVDPAARYVDHVIEELSHA